jgi:hypothetical protein
MMLSSGLADLIWERGGCGPEDGRGSMNGHMCVYCCTYLYVIHCAITLHLYTWTMHFTCMLRQPTSSSQQHCMIAELMTDKHWLRAISWRMKRIVVIIFDKQIFQQRNAYLRLWPSHKLSNQHWSSEHDDIEACPSYTCIYSVVYIRIWTGEFGWARHEKVEVWHTDTHSSSSRTNSGTTHRIFLVSTQA